MVLIWSLKVGEQKEAEEKREEMEKGEGEGEEGVEGEEEAEDIVNMDLASGKNQIPLLDGKSKASFWTCSTLV